MTEHLSQYSPVQHAAKLTQQFPGTHVVEHSIPLSEITFETRDDEMAPYRGPRDASTCPQIDALDAKASAPQILGVEKRQHLTVECSERVQVIARDNVTSYGVCALKAAANGVNLESVPDHLLTDNQSEVDIHCAFEYLGGRVVAGAVTVPIAVDAQRPGEDLKYRAV